MCRAAYLATSLPPWPSNTANSDVRAGSVCPEALAGGGSMSRCTACASSYDVQLDDIQSWVKMQRVALQGCLASERGRRATSRYSSSGLQRDSGQ